MWERVRGKKELGKRLSILVLVGWLLVTQTGVVAYAGAWIEWGQDEALWQWSDDYYALLCNGRADNFEGALAFALRMDKLIDDIKEVMPDYPHQWALGYWVWEIVPYFSYEGVRKTALYPQAVVWYPNEGARHFHVSGTAIPMLGAVLLNARYVNPASPWFNARYPLGTLVHELAHVNGIADMSDALMEPTTQLVTLEILAAMVNDGNRYAVLPFLSELAGFALDYAHWMALEYDKLAEFQAALETMYDTPVKWARYQKSMRYWADKQDDLKQMLTLYGRMPYLLLLESLETGDSRMLPSLPNPAHRIATDDVVYLLQHLLVVLDAYQAEAAQT